MMIKKVWKQVWIKTGERLSLSISYMLVSYILNEQTRVIKGDHCYPYSDCQ